MQRFINLLLLMLIIGVVWGLILLIGLGTCVNNSSPDDAFIHSPTKVIELSREGSGGGVKITSGECFILFLASNGDVDLRYMDDFGLRKRTMFSIIIDEENLTRSLVLWPALVTFPESGSDSDDDLIIHISSGSRTCYHKKWIYIQLGST